MGLCIAGDSLGLEAWCLLNIDFSFLVCFLTRLGHRFYVSVFGVRLALVRKNMVDRVNFASFASSAVKRVGHTDIRLFMLNLSLQDCCWVVVMIAICGTRDRASRSNASCHLLASLKFWTLCWESSAGRVTRKFARLFSFAISSKT